MVNPRTVNAGIIIPNTGADVGTWGSADVNPNMVSLDGWLAGVQTIAVTNAPITLTSPASFTPTPGPGPTQAENRVLKFTGPLTGHVRVTLPLPGMYIIDNQTGITAFNLTFQGATATEVVGVMPGSVTPIFNDGSRVKFVSLTQVGEMKMFAALSTGVPGWISSCTVPPWLLCDGSVYNISDFPYLGNILLGTFGGNAITTFGVPDLRGRVPLAYDATGTRITAGGGAGFNGQQLGAGGGNQGTQLVTANLPPYTPSGGVSVANVQLSYRTSGAQGNAASYVDLIQPSGLTNTIQLNQPAATFTGNAQGGASQIFSNVMPAQVVGAWYIKT